MSNKMIFRHRKCKFITVTLLMSLLCLPNTILSLAPAPVDYLVPPPLPQSSAAATRFKQAPARPQNLLAAESRTLPKFINTQQLPAQNNDKPTGLMTRVARWFGFANHNSAAAPAQPASTDQQVAAGTSKQAYYYQKPPQQYVDKENCGLCNKYPWVPMMANSIHYPVVANQWDSNKHGQNQNNGQQYYHNNNVVQNSYNSHQQQPQVLQNTYGVPQPPPPPPQIQQQAASSVKQRAVKFNFPVPYVPAPNPNKIPDSPNNIQYSTGPFLPIPVPPLLSNNALPPLYNAQNFLPPPITPAPHTLQELPSTVPAHFAENIAEHSEIHIDTVIPTQIPPTIPNKDSSFEIVKSHQLVDYVSSVEYPASYVPSHSLDISTTAPTLSLGNQQTANKISTGHYQHSTLSPHLNQHIPASQILTDPSSFINNKQQQTPQETQQTYEQTTIYNNQQPPQYLEQVQHYEYDNFVAASHQNNSVYVQQYHAPQTGLDTWSLESNDYVYATSTPQAFSTSNMETSTTYTTELESTTQPQTQENEVEFVASIQTNAQTNSHNVETTKLWPQKPKLRDTPKRLLDSPIQHSGGNFGVPRPFTRDPSDLTFRLGSINHKFSVPNSAALSQESWKSQTAVTQAPISTSTFSSIDASGQYAGMAPPSLPSSYNSDNVVLPYVTTKNRPRPFETTKVNMVTKAPSTAVYSTWSHDQNIELHTPQESMLVRAHIRPAPTTASTTTTTTVKPRTTKYLTKILASNLRELLQREHQPTKLKLSPNSIDLDIDINKLQKNIDDWTEQEYTSLSHRPSTPTIRGRSKHIPSEYLPTTTAVVKANRQSKTSKGFTDSSELPSSINNLEPLYERESTKRYQYTQLTDNHLRDIYNNFEAMKSRMPTNFKATTPPVTTTTTTTMATTASTTTTTTTTTEKPLYLRTIPVQEPEELWKKAKVSISPKTQEKVYVVTPQPRFFPQRFYAPTAAPITTTTTARSSSVTNKPLLSNVGSGFKSPRFLVRPTPGHAHKLSKISDTQSKENSRENLSNTYFSPDWFGLRGLSAYVPSEPVEIIDGNSKVLNIVTPPSNLETTTRHNIMDLTKDRHHATSKKKPTMAPSPR